jgi:hypothetical protein
MSQENLEVVRKPLWVRERSRRALDERLALRFPRQFEFYARLLFRLPPTSPIRQALAWRGNRLAHEALNRHDSTPGGMVQRMGGLRVSPRELSDLGRQLMLGEIAGRGVGRGLRSACHLRPSTPSRAGE